MAKLLLVEDDTFLIDIYSTKLKENGYEIFVVSDGEQVLPKMEEVNPDIVLLDIVLPGMDGWEILRKIRQNEKFNDTKVVILSNLGQKNEIDKGIKLGATKYLIKAHYTPSEVVEEIKKVT